MKSRKINLIVLTSLFTTIILSGCASDRKATAEHGQISSDTVTVEACPTTTAMVLEDDAQPKIEFSSEDDLTYITTTKISQIEESPPKEEIQDEDDSEEDFVAFDNTDTVVSTISLNAEPIKTEVEKWVATYPTMEIGVGVYDLNGGIIFECNADKMINGACTIKAAYANFVFQTCEAEGIDIWNTYIQYLPQHQDPNGSGVIKYTELYTPYSLGYLLSVLLTESDNVAYAMLLTGDGLGERFFPLDEFYQFNCAIGGQSDWSKWGQASVHQRKAEWLNMYNFISQWSAYGETLRYDLSGHYWSYSYILEGMSGWHDYLQKSGWTEDSSSYPSMCDCEIIDDSYLVIVLTQDYSYLDGHIDVIQGIGGVVEQVMSN